MINSPILNEKFKEEQSNIEANGRRELLESLWLDEEFEQQCKEMCEKIWASVNEVIEAKAIIAKENQNILNYSKSRVRAGILRATSDDYNDEKIA